MLALNATYYNGQLQLEKKIKISKPVKVIVTFLEEVVSPKEKEIKSNTPGKKENISLGKSKKNKGGIDINKFSWFKSMEASKNIKGSLSDEIIEERRSE